MTLGVPIINIYTNDYAILWPREKRIELMGL